MASEISMRHGFRGFSHVVSTGCTSSTDAIGYAFRNLKLGVADYILAGGADDPLKTHRREVTVVFLDLRGFTAFAETSEPEELMGVLREFHAEMGHRADAAAIGDDRLQRMARGQVVPETFTHGSSADRVRWLRRGLDSGSTDSCDTFSGPDASCITPPSPTAQVCEASTEATSLRSVVTLVGREAHMLPLKRAAAPWVPTAKAKPASG